MTHEVLDRRVQPAEDPETAFFWTGGGVGVLRFACCDACDYYAHPPTPWCPRCLAPGMRPRPVDGTGTVMTYTVNVQQWTPGQQPYVIAVVILDEQDDLRLTSNIVECDPAEVVIGMRVSVRFIPGDGVWFPVFVPLTEEEAH
ncbi:Zn-ribbon domain-containing OB-fold protein [Nocardioides sp.]|uniref:Zn-ribbon domain-containing OB-fold protein n=1 Tax=Nocardioides sp. TaxID=35761 RepID=UPI0027324C04|nr:OB-fold domain-containing protein [Nocardioides sp.]MDP3894556.1 OB-fold domain-containing protein [Nocardioides sp.]